MIFATVGSSTFPRMMTLISEVHDKVDDELVVQTAGGDLDSDISQVDYLGFSSFRVNIKESDIVIGHGGVGTLITCLEFNTPLVVIPRKESLGEVIDNHQIKTVEKFEKNPLVSIANDAETVCNKIREINSSSQPISSRPNELGEFVNGLVNEYE
ncbi:glycosyltransferase [Haloferax sp. DFSO52]|uniref:glycosyltransferase n=1 Tax=Haloferax sp. DFSO52 TaxID=3388505 RepID=UPI003A894306